MTQPQPFSVKQVPFSVNIDAEAIQKSLSDAVLNSMIGEEIKKSIERVLKDSYSSRSIVQTAVDNAIRNTVEKIAVQVLASQDERIKKLVAERLTDETVNQFVTALVEKAWR